MTKDNNMTPEDSEVVGLKDIIVNYLHKWKLFVIVFVLSFIPAIMYLIIVPDTYDIIAKIQIQDDEGTGGNFSLGEAAGLMKTFGLGGSSSSSINIDDEKAILSSNDLLKQVIGELQIQPEYVRSGLYKYKEYHDAPLLLTFDSVANANVLDEVKFKVAVSENGKVKVNVKSKEDGKKYSFEFSSLPGTMKLRQGDFHLSYAENYANKGGFKLNIVLNPISWVAEALSDEIVVEEITKSSNVLELSCVDYERRRGVDVLNTLIRLYNEDRESVKKKEADKSLAFIDDRILKVTEELSKTELMIEEYKIKNNMTDIEYDVQLYIGQMQEIQAKIIEIEAETQVIDMMNEYIKNPDNKYNLLPMLLSAQEGEKGSQISTYNQKLLERAQILKTSKPESPLVIQYNETLDHLRNSVYLSISNSRAGLDKTIQDLKNKEKQLWGKMSSVPAVERTYIDYKRQQEIYQGVYLILLQKREDIALKIGDMKSRAHVVEAAYVKKKRVAPRKLYAGLGIIFLTMILPIVFVEGRRLFLELKKEYIRTK